MTLNHNYGCFSTVAGIAGNVLRIYEVRLNEIINYKQMLVGVSCIYAVSTSTDYGNRTKYKRWA